MEKTYPTVTAAIDFIAPELLATKKFVRIKTGTYTGDAAATKVITGVGFKPKALIIYSQVAARHVGIKTDIDTTGAFVLVSNAASLYNDDHIISLNTDGFTVGDGTGTANRMNIAEAYVYIAFG
jgi:hypothetical protein